MDARLQRRVQRYGWDKAAAYYEHHWARQLKPAQSRLLAMAGLEPGDRVLDVACGTGLVTFPAAEAVGGSGAVVATDLAEEMVQRLQSGAKGRSLANVSAERMDAESLTFPDASFDVALCALGLMYVPDPARALREMRRTVRDGGRVVAAVWGARGNCGWAEIFPIVERRVASEVCPLFFQLGGGDALQYTMELNHLTDIEVERISTTLDYESGEAACGAAFAGGPVALAYARFDEETRDTVHDEYLASIEPYRSGASYAIPGEFVVARGHRRGVS